MEIRLALANGDGATHAVGVMNDTGSDTMSIIRNDLFIGIAGVEEQLGPNTHTIYITSRTQVALERAYPHSGLK